MHIHLENNTNHTIQAYTASSVRILSQTYNTHILVGAHFLFPNWQIQHLQKSPLSLADLECCFSYQPRLILLGANNWSKIITSALKTALEEKKIAVEAMPIGAACRTFNVLLSEHREVVLGIIFN